MTEKGSTNIESETGVDSFGQVEELLEKYKNPGDIPQKELDGIGYVKLEGRKKNTLLMPEERLKNIGRVDIPEQKQEVEAKKELVFGKIEVPYSGTDISGKNFQGQALKKLESMFESISRFREHDTSEYKMEKIYSLDTNLAFLFRDFKEFIKSSGSEYKPIESGLDENQLIELLFDYETLYPLILHAGNELDEPENFYSEYLDVDEQPVISSSNAKKMHSDLEKIKGRVADVSGLEKEFQDLMNSKTHSKDHGSIRETYPEVFVFCKDHGLENLHQVVVHFFSRYLTKNEMPDLAAKLSKAKNIQQIREAFQATSSDKDLDREEKVLREKIKLANNEEKRQLSGEFKKIKERKKRKVQIQKGLQAYFNLPQFVAKLNRKQVVSIQEFLVTRGDNSQKESRLYLDATWNPKLDSNPGVVSGDCTINRPLPFDNLKIPVFNVKVFDSEKVHIGNIYLLAIETQEKHPRKVWHLDAIQIPESNIDWDITLKNVINAMGNEAQKKGVQLITVNDKNYLISNYDYISRSASEIWKEQNKKTTSVDLPNIYAPLYDEHRDLNEFLLQEDTDDISNHIACDIWEGSDFQGNGTARILWENSEKPESQNHK